MCLYNLHTHKLDRMLSKANIISKDINRKVYKSHEKKNFYKNIRFFLFNFKCYLSKTKNYCKFIFNYLAKREK